VKTYTRTLVSACICNFYTITHLLAHRVQLLPTPLPRCCFTIPSQWGPSEHQHRPSPGPVSTPDANDDAWLRSLPRCRLGSRRAPYKPRGNDQGTTKLLWPCFASLDRSVVSSCAWWEDLLLAVAGGGVNRRVDVGWRWRSRGAAAFCVGGQMTARIVRSLLGW